MVELIELLVKKNGFFAFESALKVLPFAKNRTELVTILDWNKRDKWKNNYSGLKGDELFCFASDIFGEQFAIFESKVVRFNPETANIEPLCDSVDKWAELILSDYDYQTGYAIAHKWQQKFGKLGYEERLIPKIPFVLGGDYEIDNLFKMDTLDSMLYRANISNQLKDIKDGEEIVFRYTDL